MTEPLRIAIEAEVLQGWVARLQQITGPTVLYSGDHSVMQERVIEQNALIAKAVSQEIQGKLGPHLDLPDESFSAKIVGRFSF
jgi:hypothetical protein